MRAKNMQSLTDAGKRRYPGIVIYGIGDLAHKLRTSDHNEDDTAGVRAAQSDPDSNPEHRALDWMLGPAFTRAQAYQLIANLLADPAARARLFYINFENWQWSRSNGWQRRDNSDDPHPDHVHLSGWAADDENAAGWPAVDRTGGTDMYCKKGDKGDIVIGMQMDVVDAGARVGPKGTLSAPYADCDGDYGTNTVLGVKALTGGTGEVYGPAQRRRVQEILRQKVAGQPGKDGKDGKDGVIVPGAHLVVESVVLPTGGSVVESAVQ